MPVVTSVFIAALEPRMSRYEVTCDLRPGFLVRVFPNGRILFKHRYKENGKTNEVDLSDDYTKACDMYDEVATLLERRKARTEVIKLSHPAVPNLFLATSFLGLQERFLKEHVDRHLALQTQKGYRYCLDQINARVKLPLDVLEWDARLALKKAVREIAANTPVQANRTITCLSSMFQWGLKMDLVSTSPMYAVPREIEQPKSRMLSPVEIPIYLSTLQGCNADRGKISALQLALLTGMRSGELLAIRQDWLDLENGRLMIPASVTKNGHAHLVPLVPLVTDLLRRRVEAVGSKPRLYSSMTWGLRQASHRACETASITKVGPHDLRRTHATLCGSLGVPIDTISRILNHAAVGVTRKHYALYDGENEKREAYQLVADRLYTLGMRV